MRVGKRWPAFALFGVAALGGIVVALWQWRSMWEKPGFNAPPTVAPAPAVSDSPTAGLAAAKEGSPAQPLAATPEPPYDGKLRPSDVLGNIECRMARGRGAAAGTALVTLPDGLSTKFSVVDGEGTVFEGTVPFRPNHLQIGRREDGATLVALGDLRRNSGQARPLEALEPVQIYLGGQLIYQSDKVWDFAVARDASSFAIHEPSGAGASRLVVRNLQLDEERHFDFGTRMTPTNAHKHNPAMNYTPDGTQVALQRGNTRPWSERTYYFYPAGDGRSKRIKVQDFFSSLVVSSSEGYFAGRPDGRHHPGIWRLTKRRIDTRAGTTEDEWQSVLNLITFRGRLSVSDDGRFLALHGPSFQVLDTKTGQTAFRYSHDLGPRPRELAMLTNMLGHPPSPDDYGRITNVAFGDGKLRIFRRFGSHDCSTGRGGEQDEIRYRECIRDHRERGRYKAVADVYDLTTLAPDSQPTYRVEIFEDTDCMEGEVPIRGLQNVAGELTYLTNARSTTSVF